MTKRSAPPFVVIPEFRVRPQVKTAFLDAALDDARRSVADEAGCRRFDVVCPEDAEETVLFYEVYDDRVAFEEHLRTPHLMRFRAAMKALKVEETVVRFASLENS
ncbi:antibiotic biosynthesis monooxygenase [Mesorhizobium sp. B3-1-6]|uniref:putative quinol monooxygenase n=1 Tax=Mesorhizobium sp. B3-1-6 TaxID=2589895 RepID=UPI00112DAB4D|nr:putative quinol monooxygenase [Mesorhizobium sp. B3-1-6]TPI35820.1 antibiotic biosynthesis monooxygenase [Mesorhizobium sp. B3-1-6]